MHSTDKSRYKEPLSPLTNYQGPKNCNLLMWFISINIYILDIRITENLKYFYTTSFTIIASPLHITTTPWFYNKIFSKTNKKKRVKTAGFLCKFLHSNCCDMFFWLSCMNKIWPHTDTQLEKKEEYFNSLYWKLWLFYFDTTPKLDKWKFHKD